ATVRRQRERVRRDRWSREVAANGEPVLVTAEGEREDPGARAAVNRSGAHLPAQPAVVRAEDSCLGTAAGSEPRVPPVIADEALAARREGELPGQRRRHVGGVGSDD